MKTESEILEDNQSSNSTDLSIQKSKFGPSLKLKKLNQISQLIGQENNQSQILISQNFKYVQCELCGQQVPQGVLEDHWGKCLEQIPCEFCSELIIKGYLRLHYQECNERFKVQYVEGNKLVQSEPQKVDCSICFLPMTPAQPTKYLQCAHRFHTKCVMEWLEIKNMCPLCDAVQKFE